MQSTKFHFSLLSFWSISYVACWNDWNHDESYYSQKRLYPCELEWEEIDNDFPETFESQYVSINSNNKFVGQHLEYGKWKYGMLEIEKIESDLWNDRIIKWNGKALDYCPENFYLLRNPYNCKIRLIKYPSKNIFQTSRIIFKSGESEKPICRIASEIRSFEDFNRTCEYLESFQDISQLRLQLDVENSKLTEIEIREDTWIEEKGEYKNNAGVSMFQTLEMKSSNLSSRLHEKMSDNFFPLDTELGSPWEFTIISIPIPPFGVPALEIILRIFIKLYLHGGLHTGITKGNVTTLEKWRMSSVEILPYSNVKVCNKRTSTVKTYEGVLEGSLFIPGVSADHFKDEAMEMLQNMVNEYDSGESEIQFIDSQDGEITVEIRVKNYSQVFAEGNDVYTVPLDGYHEYVQIPC